MLAPVVVKCGGNSAVDATAVCTDVAVLAQGQTPVVLVHGGSAEIENLGRRMGVPDRRLVSPDGVRTRYTDDATLEVVLLALAGSVKPRLVTALAGAGQTAIGLTGLDGSLLRARRKHVHRSVVDGRVRMVRDDHSGRVTHVNATLLRTLLRSGAVPVVSPPAIAEDGRAVNVDADRVAAAVAGALGARTLILLTGAAGVLADPFDAGSVLARCDVAESGPPPFTGGGIGLKLIAAREALLAGVPRVLVGDGRVARPVTSALSGTATEITIAPTRVRTDA